MKRSAVSTRIRVFLVDDHPIVRRGFQLLLGMERDLMVCGEAESEKGAFAGIAELRPHLAVVDLSFEGGED